jgi:type IV pilus assembly protein PilM
MMAKAAWGIDVSRFSIKAVHLVAAGNGAQLLNVQAVPISRGGDNDEPETAMREAMAALVARNRFRDPVVCSLPSHVTFNRFIKLPPVDTGRLQEIVQYEAQQHIPYPLAEVVWDYQVIQRDYAPGEELELVIFAVKKDTVQQFLATAGMAGLRVDIIQFAPVALYNFFMFDQRPTTTTIVLDMGADNSDLLVLDGQKFWIRNLPLSGNDVTKALMKQFGLSWAEAEKLKTGAAQSAQAARIFQVIQPVLKDLVGEIHRSIGFYKTISRGAKFDQLVLVGNTAKLLNLQKYLSQNLQIPVNRLARLGRIAPRETVHEATLQGNISSLGVALGLALQGIGQTVNAVNLLPPEVRRRREMARKRPYLVGVAAGLAALAGTMYIVESSRTEKIRAQASEVQNFLAQVSEIRSEQRRAAQFDDLKTRLSVLASYADHRDTLLKAINTMYSLEVVRKNDRPDVPDTEKLWILSLSVEEVQTQPFSSSEAYAAATLAAAVAAGTATEEQKAQQQKLYPPGEAALKFKLILGCGAIRKDGKPDTEKSRDFVVRNFCNPLTAAFPGSDKPQTTFEPSEPVAMLATEEIQRQEAGRTGGGGTWFSPVPAAAPAEAKYFRLKFTWAIPLRKAPPAPTAGTAAATGG